MNLSAYEKHQIQKIGAWKREAPSIAFRAIGFAITPMTRLILRVIPDSAIKSVLDFSSSAAEWLTDTDDVVRDAGVGKVEDLRKHDLEKSDRLANAVHNRAIAMATAEGGATGAAGIFGLAVDVPALIVIALRTIHKIGACYGFEVRTKSDRDFVLAVLSVSGSNDMIEKVAALSTLRAIEVSVAKTTWKALAEKAATEPLGKEASTIGIKNLARQISINLTKRKTLQAIPAIGAIVGASVNGWYVKEVGWAARHAFQERWLIENHKIMEIA
ncbi:MAG: EcsC family protein [Pseudomonadota bacterium]